MLENLLFQTVTIQTPTYTKDASGGYVKTYTNTYSNIGANIQPVSDMVRNLYAEKGIEVSHTVFTTTNVQSLKTEDIIVYGSRTFYFRGVRNQIELDTVWAVDCAEYQ